MDLKDFSIDAFEQSKAFHPILPNGKTDENFKIFIKSVKSKNAVAHIDDTSRKQKIDAHNKQKQGHVFITSISDTIKSNIDYACLLIDRFEGVQIDGKQIESTPENITMLMEKFDWLRGQVIDKAQEDTHFFTK